MSICLPLRSAQTPGQQLGILACGDAAFCIGLSEPDAGSDLTSLRSRATKVDGGWRLQGRKFWTTYAQHCDFMIGLFRTGGPAAESKQHGLSQFLIDLCSSGLAVHPIRDLTGEAHFNEVVFDGGRDGGAARNVAVDPRPAGAGRHAGAGTTSRSAWSPAPASMRSRRAPHPQGWRERVPPTLAVRWGTASPLVREFAATPAGCSSCCPI